MLILIAESKKMAACDSSVSGAEYNSHRPVFEKEASMIMDSLRDMNADTLLGKVKISLPMVRRLQQMIYEYPDKSHGDMAINAFTGVVFNAFRYTTLSEEARMAACRRVRIISSLYGWLQPDDIIRQYRFDFTNPLTPEGATLASYWKEAVTSRLLQELADANHTDMLNLLPADAARCIDWKQIAQKARVWRADFREMLPAGATRTPNSNRLKTLRGQLLRQIITENISSPEQLTSLAGDDYIAVGGDTSTGDIIFHTAP